MIHVSSDARDALAKYLDACDPDAKRHTLDAVHRRLELIDRNPDLGTPLQRDIDGYQRRALNVLSTKLQMHYTVADNGDLLVYDFTQGSPVRDLDLTDTKFEQERRRTREAMRELNEPQLRAQMRALLVERDDVHRLMLATAPTSSDFEALQTRARTIDVKIDTGAIENRARLIDAVEKDPTGHLARCTEHLADDPQRRTAAMRGLEQRHRLLGIDHADLMPATADRVLTVQNERVMRLRDRGLQRGAGTPLEVGF